MVGRLRLLDETSFPGTRHADCGPVGALIVVGLFFRLITPKRCSAYSKAAIILEAAPVDSSTQRRWQSQSGPALLRS